MKQVTYLAILKTIE